MGFRKGALPSQGGHHRDVGELGKYDDWRSYGYTRWSFYRQERRHHAVRFYSEYLPAGRYHLAYVAQAIAPGAFTVLPTHVEEMYDANTVGQGVPAMLHVLAE